MKVLIPMAGAGSRFAKADYSFPKPLISVEGKTMIEKVVENIGLPQCEHIFIVQQKHMEEYTLEHHLRQIAPNCKIVTLNSMTEGAACTTLLAKKYIQDESLLIANSDQIVEWGIGIDIDVSELDGLIYTHEATHPKWSYAKVDEYGYVTEVAEKKPISTHATVGVYYWASGAEYVQCAEKMIADGKRVNNEFYVAPVYNELIEQGRYVKIAPVRKMWGTGTPEDLELYLNR